MDTETVKRLRGVAVPDPYSQESVDLNWDDAAELPMETLAPPEPRPSSEPVQDARNAVVSGWTLYLAHGEDVTAADRMEVRGEVFEVLGDPADWGSAGIVVQTGRTEG